MNNITRRQFGASTAALAVGTTAFSVQADEDKPLMDPYVLDLIKRAGNDEKSIWDAKKAQEELAARFTKITNKNIESKYNCKHSSDGSHDVIAVSTCHMKSQDLYDCRWDILLREMKTCEDNLLLKLDEYTFGNKLFVKVKFQWYADPSVYRMRKVAFYGFIELHKKRGGQFTLC
jgi:hypothetical protein